MLGRLITEVRITGEDAVITEYGEPVAKLIPYVPVIPEQRQSPGEE